MSGIIGSKINIRGSGRIAKLGTDGQVLTSAGAGVAANYEDITGGISWQAVETGSTMTAVAGEGYWIDTSSNACVITLPASASNGDTIIFADFARNWGTNGIEIDSNGLNYQGDDDTFDVEYGTDGQAVKITYSDATNGWIPTLDKAVAYVPSKGNPNGIMAYGYDAATNISNLVDSDGVIGADVSGVGTSRYNLAACEYGGDKGIFGFGLTATAITNLVSNTGVVATDTAGVGTVRGALGGCSYGGDKGIFAFGETGPTNVSNLVSNTGVVATDSTGVGTAKGKNSACEYGDGLGIFGFGFTPPNTQISTTNLVSNTGVVSTDVTGVGQVRQSGASCSWGTDGDKKGIFGFGWTGSTNTGITNLVSNTGVVATDTAAVASARQSPGATQYGGDKGLFAFGTSTNARNLISNTGVVSSDASGAGTARLELNACSYG
jgi:hypothetical protein